MVSRLAGLRLGRLLTFLGVILRVARDEYSLMLQPVSFEPRDQTRCNQGGEYKDTACNDQWTAPAIAR